MAAPDEPRVTLAPVGGGSRLARSWIAVAAIAAVSVAIVGAGLLGGSAPPAQPPAPSRAAGLGDATARTVASGGAPPAPLASARADRVISPPNAGYEVDYARDGSHRPIVAQDGALAIFGFGERVPDGSYPGAIRVGVGTPARGAPVSGVDGQRFVFGETVEALLSAYLAVDGSPLFARWTYVVDGSPGVMLDFAPAAVGGQPRSVALLVHGNRAFVITAVGFERLLPGFGNPANAGLAQFLAGFQFTTPLYVSRELGFQVPQPLDEVPVEDLQGTVVFAAGEASDTEAGAATHAISVAVGSERAPAVIQVLPGLDPAPVKRIWARSLVELQGAYVDAIGGSTGSSTTITLGGELALLVERPTGLASTVLAVRDGRAYIVSTSGRILREPAPGFEAFLSAFTFLDAGD